MDSATTERISLSGVPREGQLAEASSSSKPARVEVSPPSLHIPWCGPALCPFHRTDLEVVPQGAGNQPLTEAPAEPTAKQQDNTYQGDVSYWGKAAMSEGYFEDGSRHSSQGQQSLSSGLSPRDAHPRARPWDEDEGFRVSHYFTFPSPDPQASVVEEQNWVAA